MAIISPRQKKGDNFFVTEWASKKRDSEKIAEIFASSLALSEVVPNTVIWGLLKAKSIEIARMLAKDPELSLRAARMRSCADALDFGVGVNPSTGVVSHPFDSAWFCHDPLCPVCQWRRALRWRARLYAALQTIIKQYDPALAFPTLTVLDPDISDLKNTIQRMSKAWAKLVRRKPLSGGLGWFWTIEIKRGEGDSVHPHLHALVILPKDAPLPSGGWWQKEWASCLSINYKPRLSALPLNQKDMAAVVQYLLKAEEITPDPPYYIALAHQLPRVRLLSSGGMLKLTLKQIPPLTPPRNETTAGLRAEWSGTEYNLVFDGLTTP
jgi:hypothetical protein